MTDNQPRVEQRSWRWWILRGIGFLVFPPLITFIILGWTIETDMYWTKLHVQGADPGTDQAEVLSAFPELNSAVVVRYRDGSRILEWGISAENWAEWGDRVRTIHAADDRAFRITLAEGEKYGLVVLRRGEPMIRFAKEGWEEASDEHGFEVK
jgi:hypothetical protein